MRVQDQNAADTYGFGSCSGRVPSQWAAKRRPAGGALTWIPRPDLGRLRFEKMRSNLERAGPLQGGETSFE